MILGSACGFRKEFGLQPIEVCCLQPVFEASERDFVSSLQQRNSRVSSRRNDARRSRALPRFEEGSRSKVESRLRIVHRRCYQIGHRSNQGFS